MYKYLLLLFCIIFIACNTSDVPRGILPMEKMRPLLWQQIKADIYTRENLVNDSVKNKNLSLENVKLQAQIFKNYGVTKDAFYESYNYYLAREDKLGEMLDTLIAQQTKLNFEELTNQANNYREKPKNIFMDAILKQQSVFTMCPDTLGIKPPIIMPIIAPRTISTENLFNKRKFNINK